MSVNKVILVGNVGGDPEIKSMNNGNEVANFSLATNESWKDKDTGERKDRTEWHRIVVFSQPLINVIRNYIKKGSKLYIEGALQTRKWTDQSGIEKYSTEVVLQGYNSTLRMIDSRNSQGEDNMYQDQESDKKPANDYKKSSKSANEESFKEDLDDEIPF